MHFLRSMIRYLFGLAVGCCLMGCGLAASIDHDPPDAFHERLPALMNRNQIEIFFLRHENHRGQGRMHLLTVDRKVIGPLTANNYYRLMMWPGEYEFSIRLPKEEFLGQVQEAMTISRRVTLANYSAGSAFLCSYTDGSGTGGLCLVPVTTRPSQLEGRIMAGSLDARQTAQATRLFTARYDGPAVGGQPHGKGLLQWPDGSLYIGVLSHGVPTSEARFYFPGGRSYMGSYNRGRPDGEGVLISIEGEILFAGRFKNEAPHGVGLRNGKDGPEYCLFNLGSDMTRTFRQLAAEELDREDGTCIAEWSHQIEKIGAEEHAKRVRQLKNSRQTREAAREAAILEKHRTAVEKRRQRCRLSFAKGLYPCTCAPFAEDWIQWQACTEP
jgi:hypothetical protein